MAGLGAYLRDQAVSRVALRIYKHTLLNSTLLVLTYYFLHDTQTDIATMELLEWAIALTGAV